MRFKTLKTFYESQISPLILPSCLKDAAGSIQVCAGQEAGSEAAAHVISDVYEKDETKAVLLVDADNAFNSINRKAMLHNISITYPLITTFICCREL